LVSVFELGKYFNYILINFTFSWTITMKRANSYDMNFSKQNIYFGRMLLENYHIISKWSIIEYCFSKIISLAYQKSWIHTKWDEFFLPKQKRHRKGCVKRTLKRIFPPSDIWSPSPECPILYFGLFLTRLPQVSYGATGTYPHPPPHSDQLSVKWCRIVIRSWNFGLDHFYWNGTTFVKIIFQLGGP